jgi:hypothetical protein
LAVLVSPYLETGNAQEHYWNETIESFAPSVSWLPTGSDSKDFDDVPEHIAAAASEAYKCRSIGALRAAVMLARAVVEASAKDRGILKGMLVAKIDEMHAQGLIREHIREAAHEIRHLGNDIAHGDFTEPVTEEEADETLTLVAELLSEVFQSPARVERRRRARLAKTEQQT